MGGSSYATDTETKDEKKSETAPLEDSPLPPALDPKNVTRESRDAAEVPAPVAPVTSEAAAPPAPTETTEAKEEA